MRCVAQTFLSVLLMNVSLDTQRRAMIPHAAQTPGAERPHVRFHAGACEHGDVAIVSVDAERTILERHVGGPFDFQGVALAN
jgi:hypothetical protein